MFLNKIKRLNNSHITTIFKGNFISKFVLVIGGLLLAKYYGSTEYGVFSIYLSIMSIFTVVLGIAQEHMIMLEGNEQDVNNNFSTAGIISSTVMFLAFLLVFVPFDIPKNILFLGIFTGFIYLFTNNAKFLLAKKIIQAGIFTYYHRLCSKFSISDFVCIY